MEKIDYESAVKNIRKELKSYVEENRIKSLVLGVSGGMDSCLCAALAKPVCDELEIPLMGRSLPISTNAPDEIDRATLTGKAFCTNFREVNLAEYFNDLSIINTDPSLTYIEDKSIVISDKDTDKAWRIRNGNIKARLRMIYLYNLASLNKGMVLSTDNYTEYLLGFWTRFGDEGDFGMIQKLWKSEVYDMAEWMAEKELKFQDEYVALTSTIEALATDGLGVSSLGDLGQIMPDFKGSSRDGYKEVDKILQLWVERHELGDVQKTIIENPLKDHPVIQRHIRSEFKRHVPINIPRNIIVKT